MVAQNRVQRMDILLTAVLHSWCSDTYLMAIIRPTYEKPRRDRMPQDDQTPKQQLMSAFENMELLMKHISTIVAYRRALYLEYIAQGFTEAQALELIKGQMI